MALILDDIAIQYANMPTMTTFGKAAEIPSRIHHVGMSER